MSTVGGSPSVMIGVDVVDLGNPRTVGRAAESRFVERILSPDEQQAIRFADDPDLELWCHWAAKEAAFKVVSKVRGTPPPFVHEAFQVSWSEGARTEDTPAAEGLRAGKVRYEQLDLPVVVGQKGTALHALALTRPDHDGHVRLGVHPLEAPEAPWSSPLEDLERALSNRELDAVYSRASAAVRVGARRDLAEELGVDEGRLELVCAPGPNGRRPPYVLLDGEPVSRADVSLSHDGPWIAWATWVAAAKSEPSGTSDRTAEIVS